MRQPRMDIMEDLGMQILALGARQAASRRASRAKMTSLAKAEENALVSLQKLRKFYHTKSDFLKAVANLARTCGKDAK